MQSSTIHDWIKSITSIVQSVAVAAGIFFAIQQYKNNTQDAADKKTAHLTIVKQNTIDATNNARVATSKVIDFTSALTSGASEDAVTKDVDRFFAETAAFRSASDKINSGLFIGTMSGDFVPERFCDAQHKLDSYQEDLARLGNDFDLHLLVLEAGEDTSFQLVQNACQQRLKYSR